MSIMAKFELTGKIEKIGDTIAVQTKNGSINKSELVIAVVRFDPNTGEQSGDAVYVAFEFVGKSCDKMASVKVGDMVTVAFYLTGHKYTSNGVEKVFTKVCGYDVQPYQSRKPYTPAQQIDRPEEIDKLPF